MSGFQFKSGVKTLDVKSADGENTLKYEVNVGQKEQTKTWITKIMDIDKTYEKMSKDASMFDALEELEKEVVESVLGEKAWTELWAMCDSNVLAMLGFMKYLADFLQKSMKEFYSDYV